jgi:hypothetical protein
MFGQTGKGVRKDPRGVFEIKAVKAIRGVTGNAVRFRKMRIGCGE